MARLKLKNGLEFSDGSTQDTAGQPLDSDLTTIAGLTPTDGNVIKGNGTAWTSGTVTATVDLPAVWAMTP